MARLLHHPRAAVGRYGGNEAGDADTNLHDGSPQAGVYIDIERGEDGGDSGIGRRLPEPPENIGHDGFLDSCPTDPAGRGVTSSTAAVRGTDGAGYIIKPKTT